ncbi:hypothetical protein GCM10018781_60890 [Kitasatospora indigofera]|uniref:Uncharacterized protein n=2 Tax=Kitasatospora indigofera TaxID=67307 RepID=A0A919GA95_9ACTN|nr:hypothetical protein GCM10018781_60890 [Kitasatospora indigofera]
MATGSGKSYVGAVAGQKLVVLVVLPTLDLLVQMIGSWRAAGRSGTCTPSALWSTPSCRTA